MDGKLDRFFPPSSRPASEVGAFEFEAASARMPSGFEARGSSRQCLMPWSGRPQGQALPESPKNKSERHRIPHKTTSRSDPQAATKAKRAGMRFHATRAGQCQAPDSPLMAADAAVALWAALGCAPARSRNGPRLARDRYARGASPLASARNAPNGSSASQTKRIASL